MQRTATTSRPGVLVALAVIILAAACSSADSPGDRPAGRRSAAPAGPGEPATSPAASPAVERPRVIVLGDSLTAGYGLDRSQSYPALLQERVDRAGYGFEVVNMGVSGDTSAGGVRRADWALEGDVRVLILALGANDGLRGLPPPAMHDNLGTIIDRAKARGAAVLLCGMEAPPNLGRPHTEAFRQVYRTLAREKGVEFLPFLLEGVAGAPSLNQADGIHPNAEGARRIAGLVWERLEPMLKAAARS